MPDEVYNRIKNLTREKRGIANSIKHYFERIRTDSYNSLPTEQMFIFHNFIMLLKSFVNKKKNHHYYYRSFKKRFVLKIRMMFIKQGIQKSI